MSETVQSPSDPSSKPFLAVLNGEVRSRPPFWLMRQAGRYLPEFREVRKATGGFLDLCFNPDRACEVTLQPLRRYDMDAAILFSDILVVPHALGQPLEYREGEGPVLDPIRDVEGLARLDPTRLQEVLEPVYGTLRLLRSALAKDFPKTALIGFAGAPWTVACYMVEGRGSKDYMTTKTWAFTDPDGFQRLIDLLVDSTSAYLLRQVEAGAEVVKLFDSWAGALPAPFFARWSLAPMVAIARRLRQAHPDLPIILFPRGAGIQYPLAAEEASVTALALDSSVPMEWAAKAMPDRLVLQGNLDPAVLVAGGALLDQEIDRICDAMTGRPFLFNLGHGVVPQTPPEHVARLAERLALRG